MLSFNNIVMDHKPLVSIVTPCFNSGQFIESCIMSVLAQDYPYVEHIIQDGASTDGTIEILNKYTGKVEWVSEPDKGQSDGLNKALKRCKGDIILVLNADDELLPHAASWGVEQMAKHPHVAVVYGNQYNIDERGNIVEAQKSNIPYDFHKLLCVELVPPAQAAFIRQSYFEEVGLGADITLATCPDYEMWVRIGMKFPMVYVPGFVAKYRMHSNSEGCQPEMIHKMVHSKRCVMDRVFDNQLISFEIKTLRNRAHASLNTWAVHMLARGSRRMSICSWRYILQALYDDFSVRVIREIIYIISHYSMLGFPYRLFSKYYVKTKKILGLPVRLENDRN